MDDIDLFLQFRQHIDAISDRLSRILNDPAVTTNNPAFLICELEKPDAAALTHLRQRMMVGVVVGINDDSKCNGDQTESMDDLVRFVQFCVVPTEILLDQPTSTLSIAEGERLMGERVGFELERSMSPSATGGSHFTESVVRYFNRSSYLDQSQLCTAAAIEAAWILYELWFLDPSAPIQVTAFTKKGTGRVGLQSGRLLRS